MINIKRALRIGSRIVQSTVGNVLFVGTGGKLGQDDDFFWDNTNKRLGLGTTEPEGNLHVLGSVGSIKFFVERTGGQWVRFSAGLVGSSMKFSNTGNFAIAPVELKTDTSIADAFYIEGTGKIGLGTTDVGTAGLAIMSGDVGIGTNEPGAKLQIKGNGTTTGANFQTMDATGAVIFNILDNGTVGINTNTPFTSFHINAKKDASNGELSNQSMSLHKVSASSAGYQTAIAFGQSSISDVYGGRIAFEVSGSYSRGGFKFYTKDAASSVPPNNLTLFLKDNGDVGLGGVDPTARLHLPAGTATAGTAPFKFISGVLMTTPEAGTLEYLSNVFYIRGGDGLNIGDDTNYTEIKNDGEINLHGTARVKKTIQIPASGLKSSGVNPATEVAHGLDGALQFAKNLDQNGSFAVAIRKDTDRSIAPILRFGWSSPATTGDVKLQVQYLWRSLEEDTSSTTPDGTVTEVSTVSTTANGYEITNVTLTTPSATDRICQVRITRLGTDAEDTADDEINLLGIVLEYTSDKLGESL